MFANLLGLIVVLNIVDPTGVLMFLPTSLCFAFLDFKRGMIAIATCEILLVVREPLLVQLILGIVLNFHEAYVTGLRMSSINAWFIADASLLLVQATLVLIAILLGHLVKKRLTPLLHPEFKVL